MAQDYKTTVSQITRCSYIGFTLALAKDVGVISALIDAGMPLTVHDLATAKKLKERYVREMLGCLVSAGLVSVNEHPGSPNTYHISDDGKEVWRTGGYFSSVSMINALMAQYNGVKKCAQEDGPYGHAYGRELQQALDESKMGSEDGIITLMLDNNPDLQKKLERGIRVMEIGSGTGRIISRLATRFPVSNFIASEYSDELVNSLIEKLGHLPNVSCQKMDVCNLSAENTQVAMDWIFVLDVIHDLPHPSIALKGIRKMLDEDNGLFTSIELAGTGSHVADAADANAAQLYSFSTFLCVPQSFQSQDCEAYGACWGKSTALQVYASAGFRVDLANLGGPESREILLICKPLK